MGYYTGWRDQLVDHLTYLPSIISGSRRVTIILPPPLPHLHPHLLCLLHLHYLLHLHLLILLTHHLHLEKIARGLLLLTAEVPLPLPHHLALMTAKPMQIVNRIPAIPTAALSVTMATSRRTTPALARVAVNLQTAECARTFTVAGLVWRVTITKTLMVPTRVAANHVMIRRYKMAGAQTPQDGLSRSLDRSF